MKKSEAIRAAKRHYKRAWRDRNRDRVNAYARKWRAANPDRVKLYNERYWIKKARELNLI